jgi:PPM family protein phosphatase
MTEQLELASGAITATGRVREHNEDSYVAAAPVFVVADGMGGHEAGERASNEAIGALRELVGHKATPQDVLHRVNEARARVGRIRSGPGRDAGTTLSGVVVTHQSVDPYWVVINIGDSRTYRLADGRFEQISVDHSEVQEMLDSGDISGADAANHPMRHIVTKALGAGSWSDPDYWLLPIGPGDRMLVCSDGLTGELDDLTIATMLLAEPNPRVAAQKLVDAAVAAGGRDNVTVIVVDGGSGVAVSATAPGGHSIDDPDIDTRPGAQA